MINNDINSAYYDECKSAYVEIKHMRNVNFWKSYMFQIIPLHPDRSKANTGFTPEY